MNMINRNFTKPNQNLIPWQVTGLTDGEGSFVYSITNTGKGLTGQKLSLEFKVTQKTHCGMMPLSARTFRHHAHVWMWEDGWT